MDLLYGITPEHIKLLCDNTFLGGFGHKLEEVARMTPGQVIFMLTQSTKTKQKTMSAGSVGALAGKDGKVKGRDGAGNPIRLAQSSKSLVQRIRDGEIAFDKDGNRIEPPPKKQPKQPEEPKPRRRRRRGG